MTRGPQVPFFVIIPSGGDCLILALGVFMPEVRPLIDRMLVVEKGEELGRSFHRGIVGNNEVVVSSGFVGKVETAFVTQRLTDRFKPNLALLLSGAAALDDSLKPGEIVIGTEFEEYDTVFPLGDRSGVLKAPDSLLMRFLRVYYKGARFGKLVSGDEVVSDNRERVRIASSSDALALDMDSAAFAKTSQANGLEYIVIKVVLDNADENAKADFDRNFARFCGRPAELIGEVLKTHYIDK